MIIIKVMTTIIGRKLESIRMFRIVFHIFVFTFHVVVVFAVVVDAVCAVNIIKTVVAYICAAAAVVGPVSFLLYISIHIHAHSYDLRLTKKEIKKKIVYG